MTVYRAIKVVAGTFILISAVLVTRASKWWRVLTAFVGVNLIRSVFTSGCPVSGIFARFGIQGTCSIKK